MLIKICGLTNQEDLDLCLHLEIDFLGFIFHPSSPRSVAPEEVAGFTKGTHPRVGIFVRQSPSEILKIMSEADLDFAQLHGDYSPKDCRNIGISRTIKVFWPEKYDHAQDLLKDLDLFSSSCKYFLLDAGQKGGGHGRVITQEHFKDISIPNPWFLAGGLGPENAADLAQSLNPQGLDFNSGLEQQPGKKDKQLIDQLKSIIPLLKER